LIGRRAGLKGSRTHQWYCRKRFLRVAHLWGAWCLRAGRFVTALEVGYHGYHEFESFLMESEILRDFGQTWRPRRAKGKSPLPPELWRVSDTWRPTQRQPGWPESGTIRIGQLPEDLLAKLRPSGRPRKRH
jgi:hypothetical protein